MIRLDYFWDAGRSGGSCIRWSRFSYESGLRTEIYLRGRAYEVQNNAMEKAAGSDHRTEKEKNACDRLQRLKCTSPEYGFKSSK